jgi:nitrate reductase delta subunit
MMNPQDRSVTQQVSSLLLRYPDETLAALKPLVHELVESLPGDAGKELSDFLVYLDGHDLLTVQRHYVETFDMRRKCSPYLTYWTHGDTRNRGMALLHFKEAYHEAGLTIDEAELPDHLAVVLEFAGTGDAELGNALLAEHRGVIALLHDALVAVDSPYAHVVGAVLSTTSPLTPEDELLMQRIATTGPPTEMVGVPGAVDLTLEPFGVQSSDLAMEARR